MGARIGRHEEEACSVDTIRTRPSCEKRARPGGCRREAGTPGLDHGPRAGDCSRPSMRPTGTGHLAQPNVIPLVTSASAPTEERLSAKACAVEWRPQIRFGGVLRRLRTPSGPRPRGPPPWRPEPEHSARARPPDRICSMTDRSPPWAVHPLVPTAVSMHSAYSTGPASGRPSPPTPSSLLVVYGLHCRRKAHWPIGRDPDPPCRLVRRVCLKTVSGGATAAQ